jgi:hypothetical protein
MRFEIYCDESRPDLLVSTHPNGKYMVIGSLWLAAESRQTFKNEINLLRNRHKIGPEFKWQKISPSRSLFYKELMEWFYSKKEFLRFRCIAVEQQKLNLVKYHDSDQELGFYKFYYQLLHHWILDFNDYVIFCDFKSNRSRDRLQVLQRCLELSNLSSNINNVQAIRSDQSVLIQLTDVLTGAASARLNGKLSDGSAKDSVVKHLENLLRRNISHTLRSERKFNVFVIDFQGGW